MVANDFGRIFEQHPRITRVFFNGAAAEKNFNRLGPRRAGSSVPAAAVDQPRADHALRRQTGGLAGSHHRTSITVRRAFAPPILSSAGHRGLQMTAAVTCRTCGGAPRAGARFCDACGAPIAASKPSAEYKQVTVLFADVVRSMDIAAAEGSERLREIMAELLDRSTAVVKRYGGTLSTSVPAAAVAPPHPAGPARRPPPSAHCRPARPDTTSVRVQAPDALEVNVQNRGRCDGAVGKHPGLLRGTGERELKRIHAIS